MTPEIVNCLRLSGDVRPPSLVVFKALEGRVITGALVGADRSCWAPVRDGVVELCETSTGSSPPSAEDLVEIVAPSPLFTGHREWTPISDLHHARAPFSAIVDQLLAEAEKLAARLKPGAAVIVSGDDSGWAACSVAALLPDQVVIALIDKAGPLGLAGCRHLFGASDAPNNVTVVVTDSETRPLASDAAAAVIDIATFEHREALAPPLSGNPERLHALINPDVPIDLNRAKIGERPLSDAETKLIYWASRAASVARTAERTGYSATEVVSILARLQAEGFVRLQCLPASLARLHVFWRTGEVLMPLAELTLGHVAKFGFHRFADRVYVQNADDSSAMKFGEAAEVIQRTAAALRRDGVGKGDRVCVHAITHVEVPLIFWACVHLGAVFVPIGSIWSNEIAANILDRCQPKALFINDEVKERVPEKWRAKAIRLDPASDTADPAAREPVFSDWLGDANNALAQVPSIHVGPDECAIILFTSGTTGTPKGVQLSHSAIFNSACLFGETTPIAIDDVLFSITEYISPGALFCCFVTSVMCGASMVIADPKRRNSAIGLAEIYRNNRVTVLKAVPASLRALGQVVDKVGLQNFNTLRVILAGTGPLHQETLDALGKIRHVRVVDGMGGTELSGPNLLNDLAIQRGSILVHGGYPRTTVTQTVDDNGSVSGDGFGRIRVYSDRVMIGYLDDPVRTAETLIDGWFLTGDMGHWQPGGPLRIAGRAVEMIKSAWGDKVFPSEIEIALMRDRRVFEAAACGFTDTNGVERIAAFVTPNGVLESPDGFVEDLKDRVRRLLSDSKVPNVIVLVEEMPRLSRDKINKSELIKRYLQP